jgi:hypothetical protein
MADSYMAIAARCAAIEAAGGQPARTQATISSGKNLGDAPMRKCGMLPGLSHGREIADQSQRGDRLRKLAQSLTSQSCGKVVGWEFGVGSFNVTELICRSSFG